MRSEKPSSTAAPRVADWELPDGVSRGLWDYFHDAQLANLYDDQLQDCSLVNVDIAFVEQHCPKPGRLVDLGCGTGRALLHFAECGWWVVGVDLSVEMLTRARQKGQLAGHDLDLVQANLVDLDALADQSFDCAICLFSTLGMIAGEIPRRRFLGHVRRILRPGGKVIVHAHNRWFNIWHRESRAWLARDCWRALMGADGTGDRSMPAHDGQAALTLHLFTRRELVRLLREQGFGIVDVLPISPREDGRVPWSWCFGGLRSYGYLVAAEA